MKFSQQETGSCCSDSEYLSNGGFAPRSMEAAVALGLRREIARLLGMPPESIYSNMRWRDIRRLPSGDDIWFDDVCTVLWLSREFGAVVEIDTAEKMLPDLDDDARTLEQSALAIVEALRASGIKKVRRRGLGTRIVESPLGCLVWFLVAIFLDPKELPPPARRVAWGIRVLLYLCPLLLIALVFKVRLPAGFIPLAFFGTFFAVISLVTLCVARLKNSEEEEETAPENTSEMENSEEAKEEENAPENTPTPEKLRVPAPLLAYGALLLIPVLYINVPYFQSGEWSSASLFFFAFGTFLCFAATVGVREINFRGRLLFGGAIITIVAILWMLQPYYHVFPFFWALFAFVFTGLAFLDKDKKMSGNRGNRRMCLIVGCLFCVVGTLFCIGGVRNAWRMYSLRYEPASEIREIIFSQKDSPSIRLNTLGEIARFQKGMAASYAFDTKKGKNSGNNDPWVVRFSWKNGGQDTFSVGSGTGHCPDAVFIQFKNQQYRYQSRSLYKMLQPLLWEK